MLKIFKSVPIAVKGSLNYSLKNIASAMYNNKLINTKWEDENINGGTAYNGEELCSEVVRGGDQQ